MRRRSLVLGVVVSAVLLAASLSTGSVLAGGRPLNATLSGANEFPGPGDTDGSGTAKVTLNQGKEQVCYELTWQNIDAPTGAHIHRGAAGVAGDIVVPLSPLPSGCVTATVDLIKEIRRNPAGFYVNIHNATFPDGAIRGQLSK